MAPVIPCSISNTSLISGTAFTTRKNNRLTRCSFLGKSLKQTLFSRKPLSTSVKLFPPYRSRCVGCHERRTHVLSALGTNVAVEEQNPQVENTASENPSVAVETSEESSIKPDASGATVQSKRSRPGRKSEMPPVKNEELVPCATFTGKVRSIQPFGAFVDFGAFTDGLVHISQLSNSFVKDIGSVVSVGQEVKVRLVEANMETGRISLSMRENDDINKMQQRKDAPANSDKARPTRKNTSTNNQKKIEVKINSRFVKGQDHQGTVKKLTKSGAFISLPEGEEGFLPKSEESNEVFVNVMGSSLRVGQEVSVRVLRITNGYITLTTKMEEDVEELNLKLNQRVVHKATNPFELAFRKNKDIAAFLDEREKVVDPTEIEEMSKASEEINGMLKQITTGSGSGSGSAILEMQEQPGVSSEELVIASSHVDALAEDETSLELAVGGINTVNDAFLKSVKNKEDSDGIVSNLSKTVDVIQALQEQVEVSTENLASKDTISYTDQVIVKASEISGVERDLEPNLSGEITDGILSSECMVRKGDIGNHVDDALACDKVQIPSDKLQTQISPEEDEITTALALDAKEVGTIPEKNDSISSTNGQIDSISIGS